MSVQIKKKIRTFCVDIDPYIMYIHPQQQHETNRTNAGLICLTEMKMPVTTEQAAIDKMIMKLEGIRNNIHKNQRIENAKAAVAACAGLVEELGDDYADEFGLDNPRTFNDINEPMQECVEIMFNDIEFQISIRKRVMSITDQEIYDNRLKWIEYLKRPETKKHTDALEDSKNPDCRCCLGHACHVLIPGLRETCHGDVYYSGEDAYLPEELVKLLGMHSFAGGAKAESGLNTDKDLGSIKDLSYLNDAREITPQEIGAYLESVIMGGDDTPFEKIELEEFQ